MLLGYNYSRIFVHKIILVVLNPSLGWTFLFLLFGTLGVSRGFPLLFVATFFDRGFLLVLSSIFGWSFLLHIVGLTPRFLDTVHLGIFLSTFVFIFISFPVAKEVHTMTPYKVDGPFSLQQGELGLSWDEQVHVLVQVLTPLHGADGNNHLFLLVPLALYLHDSHLILLGAGHQNGSFDQQPVARLHTWVLLIVLGSVSGILWVPSVLLGRARKGTGPQVFLFSAVILDNCGHCKILL